MNRFAPVRVRLALFAVLFLAAGTVRAQQATRITAGGSVFTLRADGSSTTDYSPIVRLSGGVGFSFALRNALVVRPELHYTVRGASLEAELDGVPVEAVSEIAAIEVPVMLVFEIPVRGYLQPRVFAGPVVASVLDSRIRYRALGTDGEWATESDSSVEQFDLGLGLGGELLIPVGGQSVLTGVRGVLGLSNVVKGTPKRYHTGLVLYAGFEF